MTVSDELHWARGHIERLEPLMVGEQREHLAGALRHLALAVEGLAAEVGAMTGPRRREVPEDLTTDQRHALERQMRGAEDRQA